MTSSLALVDDDSFIGFKAEFEAEGATPQEVLKFFSLLPEFKRLFIKIGGCEAVTDFDFSIDLGASDIVAPMIESPFALNKFWEMAISRRPARNKRLWINIESVTGFEKLDEILEGAASRGVHGVIVGRGDLSESLGLARTQVDNEEVSKKTGAILAKAKGLGLATGVGGGVSLSSIANLRNWTDLGVLDHFETRKVLISSATLDLETSIRKALRLEISWVEELVVNSENASPLLRARLERLIFESGRVS